MKKKAGILLCVFVAAIAVYFVLTQNILNKEEERVYVSMEEASLPVVYISTMGREMNPLCGYVQDMEGGAADSLTVLPEDRMLPVRIEGYDGTVTSLQYEVRSLDRSELVERTSLKSWENGETGAKAVLPIQNLLSRDTQYHLCLTVGLEDGRQANYYTRILWTQDTKGREMVDLAADFSEKTFDYERARELVTYLEPDPQADNSSLGSVTLRSEFDQITWGGLDVQPVGEQRLTLRELDGIMGNVELKYMAAESGSSDRMYEVTENFTMKWDTQRIYMMDYDRTVSEIFSGDGSEVSGKRILLGISNDSAVSAVKSSSGKYTAFVSARDLWLFEQGTGRSASSLVRVFSFRGEDRTEMRSNYDSHDIRILNVDDSGNVDFLVYGYMNRGVHEGMMGAAFYHYQSDRDALEEKFFFPVNGSYEELAMDVNRLARMSGNGMFYIYLSGSVYAVDLSSNEYLAAARGLTDGTFAVSSDQSRMAWQEEDLPGTETIHIMNLETGVRKDIRAQEGHLMRVLGFVEDDFIYGSAGRDDVWMNGSRIVDFPVSELRIVDDDLNVAVDYRKEGIYISNVHMTDGRVHLEQMVKDGTGGYEKAGEDIIVCNVEISTGKMEGIGWYASEDRRKLYFVQLDSDTSGSRVSVKAPGSLSYDLSDTLDLRDASGKKETVYRAYGKGRLLGISDRLPDAVALCYDAMGYVTDGTGRIVWNRVDRPGVSYIRDTAASARLIRHLDEFSSDQAYGDGILVMDGRGATLHQVLYYVGKGCPVAAYSPDGTYELITGYDQYNVTVMDPETGESRKMGLQDGGAYFEAMGNDFVCGLFLD